MSQSLHFVNRHQFPAKAHLVENKDADTALKKKTKKAKRMRLIQQWCKKGWPALRSSPSIITHHPLWCCVSYLLTQLSFMLLIFIIIISIHKLWRKQEEWPIIKFWLLSLHLPTFQVRNRGPATSVSLKFKLLIYTILSRVGAFFDIIYKLEIVMFLGNQSFICSGHFAGTVAARGGFFAFQSSANFAFYTKLYFSLLYFLLPLETLPFTLLFPCSLPFFLLHIAAYLPSYLLLLSHRPKHALLFLLWIIGKVWFPRGSLSKARQCNALTQFYSASSSTSISMMWLIQYNQLKPYRT